MKTIKEKPNIIKQIEEGIKNPKIEITRVCFFNNKNFEGVEVFWSGNIGFGSMVLSIDKKTNKLQLDTERMGGKKFAKKVFEKIIDACEEID
jgi:hypothetical protein